MLLEKSNERLDLIIKLLKLYLKKEFSIDEIHYLLDLIINDTRELDEELFNKKFLDVIGNFTEDYISNYNNLPEEEITDTDSSNYILKDKFNLGLKKLYNELVSLKKKVVN